MNFQDLENDYIWFVIVVLSKLRMMSRENGDGDRVPLRSARCPVPCRVGLRALHRRCVVIPWISRTSSSQGQTQDEHRRSSLQGFRGRCLVQ